MNFLSILVSGIAALVIGMIWYNPKVFGNAWMRASGTTPDGKGASFPVMLLGSFIYSLMIAMLLQTIVIHQVGAFQATVDIKDVDPSVWNNYFEAYGNTYRSFKHGALHGFISGLFFALPVTGVSALYEKRGFKYTMIVGGYWIVTCMVMGGIMCAWT